MSESSSEYEVVVDVREGGPLRRAGDFALGVVSAMLGDPTAGVADVVVRRREDHEVELFRLESFDEEEAAQLVREVREDLEALPLAEFVARWEPAEDDGERDEPQA